MISNRFVSADGKLGSHTGYVATDFIDVRNAEKISIKCTIFTNINFVICDIDKNVLLAIDGANASSYGYTSTTEPQTISVNIPENGVFARACQRSIYYSQPSDFAVVITKSGIVEDVNNLNDEISGIKDVVIPTVIEGQFPNNVGTMSENANYNGIDYVDVEGYEKISINCTINQGVCLCVYDSNKTLLLYIDGYNCHSYGITPGTLPQTIVLNLSADSKYIRAGIRTIYYIAPSDFNILLLKDGVKDKTENNTVYVGTGADYTSILEALKKTTDDTKIHVNSGTYNIVQEYTDFYGSDFWTNYAGYANSTDYFLRGLWLTNGREIDFDPQSIVVFDYSGDNQNVPSYFSVFATGYNATIKNLRCQFNNKCRYAIHDDQGWGAGVNHFENCVFDGTSAYGCTIGGGMGSNMSYIIKDCLFLNNTGVRDISYHNNGGSSAQNTLYISGCYGTQACKILYHGTSTEKTYCLVHDNHFGSITKEANTSSSTVDNMELIAWNNVTAS